MSNGIQRGSGGGRNNSTGVTLNTILSDKRGPIRQSDEPFPRTQSNRTLLDVIRDDQTSGGSAQIYSGKKSWKHFKDKLRNRRGAAWTSTFPTPASDIPINNRTVSRGSSGVDISAVPDIDPGLMSNPKHKAPSGLQRNSSRALGRDQSGRSEHAGSLGMKKLQREDSDEEDKEEDDDEEEEESGGESEEQEATVEEEEQPVRMSLMALLAETDDGYMMDDDDDDDDDDGGEYNNCCVCMVRHTGTAFVPCGHSFCRLCSKELWVQKENCPLCNNYILEILDIF